MTNAANGSSTFLKVGPTLVVCLGLVEINSFCAFVHLVEPEFGVFTLVSQNICMINGNGTVDTYTRSEEIIRQKDINNF